MHLFYIPISTAASLSFTMILLSTKRCVIYDKRALFKGVKPDGQRTWDEVRRCCHLVLHLTVCFKDRALVNPDRYESAQHIRAFWSAPKTQFEIRSYLWPELNHFQRLVEYARRQLASHATGDRSHFTPLKRERRPGTTSIPGCAGGPFIRSHADWRISCSLLGWHF